MKKHRTKKQNKKVAPTPLVISHSAEETMRCGRLLASFLKSGDVLLLQGDLGSGKTTFVKGIAAGLGQDPNEVHSPTFVLMNVYATQPALVHCDFYRLNDSHEIIAAGLDDLIGQDTITVVEWPQRLPSFWKDQALVLELTTDREETTRCLRVCSYPAAMRVRLKKWLDQVAALCPK